MTSPPAALTSAPSLSSHPLQQLAQTRPEPGSGSPAEPITSAERACATHLADNAVGMPAERQARLAARRAFVAMKLSFLHVVESLKDKAELQKHVLEAEEPHQLWTLRASVFAALTGEDPRHRSQRQLLNRSLETMFPMETHQLN